MDNNDFRLGVRILYAILCAVILGVVIWFGIVLLHDQPLPRQDVQPLGWARIEALPR